MVKGGDGYKMIPENLREHRNTGFLDNDLFSKIENNSADVSTETDDRQKRGILQLAVAYIKKNTPIRPPTAGRIIIVDGLTGGAASATNTVSSMSSISVGMVAFAMHLWQLQGRTGQRH